MAARGDTTGRAGLLSRAAGRMAAGFIGLTYRTSTPPPLWDDHVALFRELHPFILALWHGQFMLLPALPREGVPTRVMLALHRDAELMAEALDRFDLQLIRGAGAGIRGKDRGGANAFRAAAAALSDGFSVAMTADVPPGPARRCGHGVITLARVTGRPILPVALASSRYLALNTWSRMTINLPGSRLGGSIGHPVHVPADASPDEQERLRQVVERSLDVATADAYARAGADPLRAMPGHAIEPAMVRAGRGLATYRAVTRLARPLAPVLLRHRARRGKEDPSRQAERYGQTRVPRPAGRLIWFHAASVGETNAVLPVIAELQKAIPELNVLLTTGTVTSARTAAARLSGKAVHQYAPLDVPDYVAAFLDHWRPDVGVFTESEIWPNLVLAASARDIPLALVNGRLSKTSFRRWRSRPGMALPLFSKFTVALAQNKLFALRLTQVGTPNVIAAGNLKIDAPALPVSQSLLADLQHAIGGRPVWLAASTHPGEEALIAEAHTVVARRHPDVLTLIAPRHPDRGAAIAAALAGEGHMVARMSIGGRPTAETGLFLADTLGDLGTLFSLVSIAFMGKSLDAEGGGHNPIEPVRLGAVVLTGPKWGNFEEEYKALFAEKGAIQVGDATDLGETVAQLLAAPDDVRRLRAGAAKALDGLSGALATTVAALGALLDARR